MSDRKRRLEYYEALAKAAEWVNCTPEELEKQLLEISERIGAMMTAECLTLAELDQLSRLSLTRKQHVDSCEFCKGLTEYVKPVRPSFPPGYPEPPAGC